MDLNEWKRLSRTEKERLWDTLSASEKEMVRRNRKNRGGRANASSLARRAPRELFSHSMLAFCFRAASSAAALLVGISMFVNVFFLDSTRVLLLLIVAVAAGVAALIDRLDAAIEELRELNSRSALRDKHRAASQVEKNDTKADTASES